jgi:7,8-dihydroneopterin aldolase/epimerase/oxygenase
VVVWPHWMPKDTSAPKALHKYTGMPTTHTIHLKKIRLFGLHGLYADEKLTGSEFEINIACTFLHNSMVETIEDTLNYEQVFRLVEELFAIRTDLLETLAGQIIDSIYNTYPFLTQIIVDIDKLNPPISSFNGRVGVSLSRNYT